MPVAAIEALVSLLQNSPSLSTISEILDLLASNAEKLKQSIANPISLSAGTDLFQRYIINSLQRGGPAGAAGDFDAIRAHLLTNGRLFVARAKEARRMIAQTARQFIKVGSTVLTNGGSRVVSAVLQAAAEAQIKETGAPRFRVVYAVSASYKNSYGDGGDTAEGTATVTALRRLAVPVAMISEAAVAYSMGQIDVVLVGAEGVVENGGIISRMGTYQMAVLAKASGKPMYVVAESHKFVRVFPLGQQDIGVDQNVLNFTTKVEEVIETGLLTPKANFASRRIAGESITPDLDGSGYFGKDALHDSKNADFVDYTPPGYISALISENGVLTPSAVSEELIKIWY